MAKTIGSQTILVAGSNGMTVYTYTSDTAGSGKSACSGGCLTKWPALTVAAGATPTAGSGVSGALGTITRTDNGTLQVTYNGLPLYFFSGDKARRRHQRQLSQLEPGQALTDMAPRLRPDRVRSRGLGRPPEPRYAS
jgi:predicted lipoprotein with Yx(FWY)xxD motif